MPIERRGKQKQNAYYYRFNENGEKRRREYVGTADDPEVKLVLRNDRLEDAVDKAEYTHRRSIRENEKLLRAAWPQVMLILEKWRVLQIAYPGKRYAEPPVTLDAYPWPGRRSPMQRVQDVRWIFCQFDFTPSYVEQLQRACQAKDGNAIRLLKAVIEYQRELYTGAVDLMSICRDCMVDMFAQGCPIATAGLDTQRWLIKKTLGYEEAEPVERLMIEAASLTYLESFAYGTVALSEHRKLTHAGLLSNTANQALRRFTRLFSMLNQWRKVNGSSRGTLGPHPFAQQGADRGGQERAGENIQKGEVA